MQSTSSGFDSVSEDSVRLLVQILLFGWLRPLSSIWHTWSQNDLCYFTKSVMLCRENFFFSSTSFTILTGFIQSCSSCLKLVRINFVTTLGKYEWREWHWSLLRPPWNTSISFGLSSWLVKQCMSFSFVLGCDCPWHCSYRCHVNR